MNRIELIQGTTQGFTLDLTEENGVSEVKFAIFKIGNEKRIVAEFEQPEVVNDNENYTFYLKPDVTEEMLGAYGVQVTFTSNGAQTRLQTGEIIVLKKAEE